MAEDLGIPPLPPKLAAMLAAVRRVGRPRLVGGGVRDWLLGTAPKDFDVEVAGVDFERLRVVLEPFGATDIVGRSFGVIKVRGPGGEEFDFSLPRRESKTGVGHRGFAVRPDPSLSDADAAARRDFTVNSISMDPFTGAVTDPFGGIADLRAHILRHTGPAFAEDPLRVLRAVQMAARFDLVLAPETAALCRTISGTFHELALERVWGEWEKWAEKSVRPSRGMDVLRETGWMAHFPEIAALDGTPQEPEWHPEGDVLDHTRHCLDALVRLDEWRLAPPGRRRMLSFAVLAHDFGKPGTTERAERRGAMRWISPGHETAGGPLAEAFLGRIGAPQDLQAPVRALVAHHLVHHHGQNGGFSDTQVRRLARKLAPATIDDLAVVMMADALGRPPLPSEPVLALIGRLRASAEALKVKANAPRPIVQGRHLIALGRVPGPDFRPLLDEAFEAQLDGAFADEEGGVAWLRGRLG
jgi:tRNA nucleotidyltransferase (CCA-adding enzyme)